MLTVLKPYKPFLFSIILCKLHIVNGKVAEKPLAPSMLPNQKNLSTMMELALSQLMKQKLTKTLFHQLTEVSREEEKKSMSLEKWSDVYYSASEARRRLGLTDDAFQGWIRAKKIEKIMLPRRKQGVFLKREVDEIVRKIEAAVLSVRGHEYVYRTATIEDLDAENELARLVFGEYAVVSETVKAVQAFVEKNPYISHHLYDHNRLVASINLVPLVHEAIIEFKEQGKRGWTFSADCIEQFVPGKPLECIIIDMMTTSLVPWKQREEYAAMLLRKFALRTLRTWGSQGIEIISVHSNGGSPQGKQLLEDVGFTYLGKHSGRAIYELMLEQATTPLLVPYKRALAEYKQSHNQDPLPHKS